MVIDTSAIIAILLEEPGFERFIDCIAGNPVGRELDLLLHRAKIDIVPFTPELADEARSASRKYGKGNHPAGLNFCDCCAYALSKVSGEALLFQGLTFRKRT
jgi:ribonuclease VapC